MRRPFVCSLLIGLIIFFVFRAANPATVSAATIHHYEYVFTAGFIYVYDIDNGFKLLKTVAVPTSAGMRGAVASAATGMLYLSYGSDGDTGGFQLAYNLSTDKVVWTMSYGHGIDSQSVSPDGKKIYMPAGELASGGTWYVEDSSNGNDIATISTGGSGPHNTIVSPNGRRVYMGDRDFTGSAGNNDFTIFDTATNRVVGGVTPLKSGARPFTINSKETLSFNTVTGFLGFQVGDLAAGKVIYTVAVNGSKIPGFTTQTPATIPSHGITLSPDDKEIYLIDQPNSYVHVFDVSGLPASAPVQVAVIQFGPMSVELNGKDQAVLARVAQVQRSNGGKVRIVAHSAQDAAGSSPDVLARDNFEVSRQRALTVANQLMRLGVPANRIAAEAASDEEPAYETNTARGTAANRRAEIFVEF